MASLVVDLRAVKGLLKIAAGLLALAVLSWTGVFLYWHVRITSAIRTMEKNPAQLNIPGPKPELYALLFLMNSGCRVFPYCVRSIHESNDPIINETLIGLIRSRVMMLASSESAAEEVRQAASADNQFLQKCVIQPQDTAEIRALRCRRLHEWWQEKGSAYHQWWRVWSSRCVP